MTDSTNKRSLYKELKEELVKKYGVMVNGQSLYEALGYTSGNAFRQALKRGNIQVPLFEVPNRKGKFALTKDIAAWITEQASNESTQGERME